ncbi:MAG: helix-turn-helix domain-containing protein [Spirochaetota bacterium]
MQMERILHIVDTAVRYIALHGLFLSSAMAAGQLAAGRKSGKNVLFFLLFLSFFFMEGSILIIMFGYGDRYRYFFYPGIGSVYLLGPSLYLLLRYTLSGTPGKWLYTLHFIPAAAVTVAAGAADSGTSGLPPIGILPATAGGAVHLGAYLFLIGITAVREIECESWTGSKPIITVCGMLYFSCITGVLLGLWYLLGGNSIVFSLLSTVIPLTSTAMFLILFRNPDTYQAAASAGLVTRDGRSYLEDTDIDTLTESLHRTVVEEKLYENEDLSLPQLAARMDLSTHQLSELLNRHISKNFAAYINEFRVERAKHLLVHSPNMSILDICYSVGFNSKSAFNKAFRLITGRTPREYRSSGRS